MSLADLQTPRGKARVCVACQGLLAECLVPTGDNSAAMCWLCAHHYIDHEVALHNAATATCRCKPEDVYPVRVLQARAAAVSAYEARLAPVAGLAPVATVRED